MPSATTKPCTTCGGQGVVSGAAGVQRCPMCEGSGEQFDPGLFFAYEMGPFVLAGNAVLASQSVQILDAPFKWMLAAANSTGNFTVLIRDSKNKRPFTNQQVHNLNLFGTAQHPFPLLTPFVFARRGSILADFTDISGAQNTIRLIFIGVELSSDNAQ